MNPEHAVDIFLDVDADKVIVMRCRDKTYWENTTSITAKLLGAVVSDALAPAKQSRLSWTLENKYPDLESASWQIVVVRRSNHSVTVITPLYGWGQAPEIKLAEYPTTLALGQAILSQAKYSADQNARMG